MSDNRELLLTSSVISTVGSYNETDSILRLLNSEFFEELRKTGTPHLYGIEQTIKYKLEHMDTTSTELLLYADAIYFNANGLLSEFPPLTLPAMGSLLERIAEDRETEIVRSQARSAISKLSSASSIADAKEILGESLRLIESKDKKRHNPFYDAVAAGNLRSVETDDSDNVIIDSIIRKNGLSILSGEGGLGKSWLAILMSICLANGRPFLGLTSKRSSVCYMTLEMDSVTMSERYEMLKRPGDDLSKIMVLTQDHLGRAINVMERETASQLRDFVAEHKFDVLIVDPLRNTNVNAENDSTEMGNVLRYFASLGTSIVLLHHVNVQGRIRGSTAIRDWADVVLGLRQGDGSLRLGWDKRPRHSGVSGDLVVRFRSIDGKMVVDSNRG